MNISRPPPPDQTRSVSLALAGGLDTESPALRIPPGSVIGSENYEPGQMGGYERFRGFERLDGRTKPSSATVVVLGSPTGFGASVVVGATITGLSSAATGVVAYVSSGVAAAQRVALTAVTGEFASDETLKVGATVVGTATIEPNVSQATFNSMIAGAADFYRSSITAVPGSGPIRGLAILGSNIFALRDNAGATECVVHQATTGGWTPITTRVRVRFTVGNGIPAAGQTVEQWNGAVLVASGTIARFMAESGSFSAATGVGSITVTPVFGTFSSLAYTLKVGGGATFQATTSSSANIALSPGGRWRFAYHRFTAVDSSATEIAYGVDKTPVGRTGSGASGGGNFVELDSSGVLSIITGPGVSGPHCVAINADHLFISQNNQLYHSAPGLPYDWTVIAGAAQVATGSDVVELAVVPGSSASPAMLVQGNDATAVLYGTDKDTWQLNTLSDEVGAIPLTTQALGSVVSLDQQGVRNVTPTQNFGNFSINTLTAHIRAEVLSLSPVGSSVDRINGRYRLFMADGRMLSGVPGKRWQWLWCTLDIAPNVVAGREMAGSPITLIGATDGYVYQMDVGRSFDGRAIAAWLKTSFANLGSPGVLKALSTVDIEVSAESGGSLSVRSEFDYGSTIVAAGMRTTAALRPTGSQWGLGQWDRGSWDSPHAAILRVRSRGVGENVSLLFVNESAEELPHRLTSVTLRFILRRAKR